MTVWPLRPNWRSSYVIEYEFKTEVLVSRNGREQRRALRASPRKTVSFLVTATKDRFRALMRTMTTSQGALLDLPEIPSGVRLATSAMAGDTSIELETIPDWLDPGARVVLVHGDHGEVATVRDIHGSTVDFEGPLSAGWIFGTTMCRGLQVRLQPESQARLILPGIVEGTVAFDVDPGSETVEQSVAAYPMWNGREVFLEKANWSSPQALTFSHDIETVDYGFGRISTFQPIEFGSQIVSLDFLARDKATAERLVGFYKRMRGRQGEFYAPTDHPDIFLASAAYGGSQNLFAVGTDLAGAYADDKVFKAICIKLKSGVRIYREVETITVQGQTSHFTLKAPMPYNVAPAAVDVISWMPVMRLSSDNMSVEWVTDSVAQTKLSFQSLEALAPE